MIGDLVVGVNDKTMKEEVLSGVDRRTHVHIVGATGTGKSKAMEHMIRKDIRKKRGLCLIDPHGALYGEIVRWLATDGLKRKIIFFTPASDEWCVGYNPLRKTKKDISHQRDATVKAIVKVWGADNTDETPTLERSLSNVIEVILERKMSLLEVRFLVNYYEKEKRTYLLKDIRDPFLRDEWERYKGLKSYDWEKEFMSCGNRLRRFLSTERIRRIIGQLHGSLDLRKIMDEGWILLVNLALGEALSEESARMLGTLLVNDFFLTSTERDPGEAKKKPFYLYIDECHYFLNEDISRILDQCRKFGLHAILAHQHMAQLKDDTIHDSLMASARSKLIFGGLPPRSADELVDYCYAGMFSPYAIKKVIETIRDKKIKTTETGSSEGVTKTRASGTNWAEVLSEGMGEALAEMMAPGLDGEVIQKTRAEQAGTGRAKSRGGFAMESEAVNQATSVLPWYDIEEVKQIVNIIYKTLEEQKYEAKSIMVNQPTRHCIFKRPEGPPIVLEIPNIKGGEANEGKVKRYEDEYLEACEYARRVIDADKEIKAREEKLIKEVGLWKKEEERAELPKDFAE